MSKRILKALAILHTTGHFDQSLTHFCYSEVRVSIGNQGKVLAVSRTLPRMPPTTWDCYLVPLAIIDPGRDHGAGVATSQVIAEVGETISQLNSSKISMIDPSHVKEQA